MHIGVRLRRRHRDELAAVRQPFDLVNAPACARELPHGMRRRIEEPHAGESRILVDNAAVVFVFFALLLRLGLRFLHQQRDARAVGRPAEGADAIGAIQELLGFTPGHRQEKQLRATFAIRVARREKCDRAAVRRPSRRRIAALGECQLTQPASRHIEQPEIPLARRRLHRLRHGEDQTRPVGRELQLADRPAIERLLGRERRGSAGDHGREQRNRSEERIFHG